MQYLSFDKLFNVFPDPVFIVDADVRLHDCNTAAAELLPTDGWLQVRGGEVLGCLHASEAPGGCGRSRSCGDCVIRGSVREAAQGGKAKRRRTRLDLFRNGQRQHMHLLVTAAPFHDEGERYILLILEDISELVRLESILPICSYCKKIRNDEDYWESVESYFRARADIEFSHSICDDCLETRYPEVAAGRKGRLG